MSGDDFFESEVPPALDQRVLRATEAALAENRRRQQRRHFLQLSFVPAFAAIAAIIFVWRKPQPRTEPDQTAAEALEWTEVAGDDSVDIETLVDLDLLEDLDVLEKWEDA